MSGFTSCMADHVLGRETAALAAALREGERGGGGLRLRLRGGLLGPAEDSQHSMSWQRTVFNHLLQTVPQQAVAILEVALKRGGHRVQNGSCSLDPRPQCTHVPADIPHTLTVTVTG